MKHMTTPEESKEALSGAAEESNASREDQDEESKLRRRWGRLVGDYGPYPCYQKAPASGLLAVQKRKREAVESWARDFEVPHACTTLEEVLAVPDLDAVVVSSTPNMHFPHETKGSGLFVEYRWLILIRFQDAETKTS